MNNINIDTNPSLLADADRAGCDLGSALRAIAELAAGDLLVIAGKGHETGQIIGTETYPFDDAAIAREIAGELRPTSSRLAG